MRNFVQILSILAFVLVGISPACAFISGKSSFMEICTAGGIERIAVADDFAPDSKQDESTHHAKTDCGFCFAQTHLKTAKAEAVLFSLPGLHANDAADLLRSTHVTRYELSSLTSRAPPRLI